MDTNRDSDEGDNGIGDGHRAVLHADLVASGCIIITITIITIININVIVIMLVMLSGWCLEYCSAPEGELNRFSSAPLAQQHREPFYHCCYECMC